MKLHAAISGLLTGLVAAQGEMMKEMAKMDVPIPFGPAPTGCNDYEVIIGRGLAEPGPFGSTVGDPLLAQIQARLPSARGFAIQYPAEHNFPSFAAGKDSVLSRLRQQTTACPHQKFALVGYSGGAMVLHEALADAKWDSAAFDSKVLALVLYGDAITQRMAVEMFPVPPLAAEWQRAGKLLNNCAPKDPVCDEAGSLDFWDPHTSYNDKNATWHQRSADFIVGRFGQRARRPSFPTRPSWRQHSHFGGVDD